MLYKCNYDNQRLITRYFTFFDSYAVDVHINPLQEVANRRLVGGIIRQVPLVEHTSP